MKSTLLAFSLIAIVSLNLHAEDPASAERIFKNLLAAEASRDYDAFVSDGTTLLKAALSKTQFEASCDILNSRFKGGYESTYLGELNLKGNEVYLFRLRFKDGGDDMLGTLSLKEGKISGIYFK